MLWVAVCLLLLQTVAGQNQVCQFYTEAKEEGFKLFNLVAFAQNLPNSTQAELAPLLDEAQALGNTCCSAAPTVDCVDEPIELFMRAVCSNEMVSEKNHLKSCCEEVGAERLSCFRHHRSEIPHELEPELADEENCTDFRNDEKASFESFIYSFSKWHPMVPPQVILSFAQGYSKLMMSCCDTNDTQTCFDTKNPVFQADVKRHVTQKRVICVIQKRFGDSVIMDKKTVEYNQKFPQAQMAVLQPMVERFVSTVTPCCQGDMLACMRSRKELLDVLCNNDDMTSHSAGLATCCKVDVDSRGGCISSMMHDPKPDNLSEQYDLQANIKAVCESFNASPKQAITNLLVEQSRRHPEASQGVLLRYARAAEHAFANCCAVEDYADCVNTSMSGVDLQKSITDGIAKYNHIKERMAAMGSMAFEESLFFKYTRSMPQSTFDQLNQLSEAVVDIYKECLMDDDILACEDKLTDFFNEMCHNNDMATINPQVINCCNQSYSTGLLCITSMKSDTSFHSPEPDNTTFPMEAVLCSNKEEDLAVPHKKLLYGLARYKTNITDHEYANIWNLFNTTRSMCCRKEDQGACFEDGAPDLIKLATKLLKNDD